MSIFLLHATSVIIILRMIKKIVKSPILLASVYSVCSIFIGPLTFLLGALFTKGGLDYCDGTYYLNDGSIDPSRESEFRNAQIFQVVSAGTMIMLGIVILVALILANRKDKTNLWMLVPVLFMILGYIFVILISGSGSQVC